MSIANWGWKHYQGKERSMAWYLDHPDAPDPDDVEPEVDDEPEEESEMEIYYSDRFYRGVSLMEREGGGFASALAKAASRADLGNLKRLVDAFPELFERYADQADAEEEDARDAYNVAHSEGYDAAFDNKWLHANRYPKADRRHAAWEAGWLQARQVMRDMRESEGSES